MSNQNKIQYLKTTLLTLSFATMGLMSVANAANSPFAQVDNQNTKLSIKGDSKKCGEGKCGDNMKKAKIKEAKKTTDGKADDSKDEVQETVQAPEVSTPTEKSDKVEKKCGN